MRGQNLLQLKKVKCYQCDCTFKKDITLQNDKNTKHAESQKELGDGQFGFVFDVRPGKEKGAELLRNEWNKINHKAKV